MYHSSAPEVACVQGHFELYLLAVTALAGTAGVIVSIYNTDTEHLLPLNCASTPKTHAGTLLAAISRLFLAKPFTMYTGRYTQKAEHLVRDVDALSGVLHISQVSVCVRSCDTPLHIGWGRRGRIKIDVIFRSCRGGRKCGGGGGKIED